MPFFLEGLALAVAFSSAAVGSFYAARWRRKPDPQLLIVNEAIDALQAPDNDFISVRVSDGRARYSPALRLIIAVFDEHGENPEAYVADVVDPYALEHNWSLDRRDFRAGTNRFETLATCKGGSAGFKRLVEVLSLRVAADIIERRYNQQLASVVTLHPNKKRTP